MTLEQLAAEYRENAFIMNTRIRELRRRLTAKKLCKTEQLRLNSRILALSSMRYDTLRTALIMERYYNKR